MKVFQAIHTYLPYLSHFEKKYNINSEEITFNELKTLLLKDRFYASHLLKPTIDVDNDSFYTIWDYPLLQQKWAKEKGWNEKDLKKILFAQIEELRPDVFYNCSPIRFKAAEINNSIASNIIKICWYASPETNYIDFSAYKSRLTNLPSDIKLEREFRSDLFQPSHDPVMDEYAKNDDRPIDVFFYGQYLPVYFDKRNELISKLIMLKRTKLNIQLSLQFSYQYKSLYPFARPSRLKSFFRKKVFPPKSVVTNSIAPLYGIDLYKRISQSKIVFNAAVDFSGEYKVNMRNFEALGLRSCLLSDEGIYPEHFDKGINFLTYKDFSDFEDKMTHLLGNPNEIEDISKKGNEMIRSFYSKERQWSRFQEIVAEL